jgi:ADP-ribose pyrophosphatase YjhB (NUDIX family)
MLVGNMKRTDYYEDPDAPKAKYIVPATSAIVLNDAGDILLQKRSDNDLWALPGGTMDVGESVAQCVIREVKEETGLDVKPEYIIGIYSNPAHVVAYSDGEVRQQFSICFFCTLLGGEIHISDESVQIGFFSIQEVLQLKMHPSIRLRIQHFQEHREQSFFS